MKFSRRLLPDCEPSWWNNAVLYQSIRGIFLGVGMLVGMDAIFFKTFFLRDVFQVFSENKILGLVYMSGISSFLSYGLLVLLISYFPTTRIAAVAARHFTLILFLLVALFLAFWIRA